MQIRNTLIMAVVLIFVGGFVYFYEVRGEPSARKPSARKRCWCTSNRIR